MAPPRTEKQKYRVVHIGKGFEIRHYPSVTLATVYSSSDSYRTVAYSGFRRLAGFIFGGNETNTSIAMTSPVHMDISDSGSSMSFVMPSSYSRQNLPKPNDPGVILEQTKPEYAAVMRFGGYASTKAIMKYTERLKNILSKNGIDYHGNFRFLGYNPPYQFIGRRNEIIVAVEWPEGEHNHQ